MKIQTLLNIKIYSRKKKSKYNDNIVNVIYVQDIYLHKCDKKECGRLRSNIQFIRIM